MAAAASVALLAGAPALALPAGGVVTASTSPGATTITPSSSGLTINQTNQRAFIDWASFNIAAGETVTFNQPSAAAIAFNRVPVGQPATIAGTLTANGAVWMFTPGGLTVGATGVVNTASFVATLASRPQGSEQNALTTNSIVNPGPAASSSAAITIASGGVVRANSGFVGLVGKTINQNGSVTSSGATSYLVSDGGGFTFTTQGGALVLAGPAAVGATGAQVQLNHGGTTQAGSYIHIFTPGAGLLTSGLRSAINLTGVLQANGALLANETNGLLGPVGVLITAGGFATTPGRIGVDTSLGQISATSGVSIQSGNITVGRISANRLVLAAGEQLTTAQPLQISGSVLLTGQSGVRIGSNLSAATSLNIYSSADIVIAGNIAVSNNSVFGDADSLIYAGGNVSVSDNVSVVTDGYLDIIAGDFGSSSSSSSQSTAKAITIGTGATLTGGVGLGLEATGKLTIGRGARVTSRYGKNVIAKAAWPFFTVSDDNVPANDGGMSLLAAEIDLQGDVYSFAENGAGRGPILIQAATTSIAATLGGTEDQPGFHLSNAEFQRLHGGLFLMASADVNESSVGGDLIVRDLTLDSANLDSLWLGSLNQQSIRVLGTVQGAGPGTVDLRLGFLVVGYDDEESSSSSSSSSSSRFAVQVIPRRIEISGALGTLERPLGQVGLISAGDILIGSPAYIEAARAADFDTSKAPLYGPANANHLFVSASGLQLASPSRILQQNTAAGTSSAGLRIGAPTAERPLILAPDLKAFLASEQLSAADTPLIDYKAGPTKVELFAVFTTSDSSNSIANSRQAAGNAFLLGSPLVAKPDYKLNACGFGSSACGSAEIPLFQPQLVALVSPLSSESGGGADDSAEGDNNLVLNLIPTTTAMADDEEEQKRRVSLPITGSGNGDLWIPLDALP